MSAPTSLKRTFSAGKHVFPAATVFVVLTLGMFSLSCGDFTLFGDNNGNGGGNGGETGDTCEKVFAFLSAYQQSAETAVDNQDLAEPVAVVVVPAGMSFTVPGTSVTAGDGDAIVADPGNKNIAFYDASDSNQRHVLEDNIEQLGGVAVYYEELEISGQPKQVNLLLYTAYDTGTQSYNLFIHDLDSSLTGGIPKDYLQGSITFTKPGALAVGKTSDKRGVFIVDDEKKVVRLSLKEEFGFIIPDSVGPIAEGFSSIQGVTFFNQNGELYLTEPNQSQPDNTEVYKIDNALDQSTSSPVQKSSLTAFVPSTQLFQAVGLDIALTKKDGTEAKLLVFSNQTSIALRQFDPDAGGSAEETLTVQDLDHLDVAYDCGNERILYTQKQAGDTGLFELRP